jgi:asparagine synthase (glutamine-hydrolysing)
MCGIFGIVARNARIPDGVLERGTQSLAHRGPDDSGTILLRDSIPEPIEIGLGNRRLAILDLSATGSSTTARSTTSATFATNSNKPA